MWSISFFFNVPILFITMKNPIKINHLFIIIDTELLCNYDNLFQLSILERNSSLKSFTKYFINYHYFLGPNQFF